MQTTQSQSQPELEKLTMSELNGLYNAASAISDAISDTIKSAYLSNKSIGDVRNLLARKDEIEDQIVTIKAAMKALAVKGKT